MENGFQAIGPLTDFPEGSARLIQVGKNPVLVIHRLGSLIAFDDYCPHRAGPLSEGVRTATTITCPWHGAKFHLDTGEPISGPCRRGLRMHRIAIEGGQVYLARRDPAD